MLFLQGSDYRAKIFFFSKCHSYEILKNALLKKLEVILFIFNKSEKKSCQIALSDGNVHACHFIKWRAWTLPSLSDFIKWEAWTLPSLSDFIKWEVWTLPSLSEIIHSFLSTRPSASYLETVSFVPRKTHARQVLLTVMYHSKINNHILSLSSYYMYKEKKSSENPEVSFSLRATNLYSIDANCSGKFGNGIRHNSFNLRLCT